MSATKKNSINYDLYINWQHNGENFDLPQPPSLFFPGKNQIQKIREKSGSEISGIFDQILVIIYKNGQIFEK